VLYYKALINLNKFPEINWWLPVILERIASNREKTVDLCLSPGPHPEKVKFVYPFNPTGYAS